MRQRAPRQKDTKEGLAVTYVLPTSNLSLAQQWAQPAKQVNLLTLRPWKKVCMGTFEHISLRDEECKYEKRYRQQLRILDIDASMRDDVPDSHRICAYDRSKMTDKVLRTYRRNVHSTGEWPTRQRPLMEGRLATWQRHRRGRRMTSPAPMSMPSSRSHQSEGCVNRCAGDGGEFTKSVESVHTRRKEQ
jgi:hypothetical protein